MAMPVFSLFSENPQFRVSPSPLDAEKVVGVCARMWFIEVAVAWHGVGVPAFILFQEFPVR
jgi:hypothetical protein